MKQRLKQLQELRSTKLPQVLFIIIFAAIGSYLLLLSHAQTPYAVATASSGNPTNGATTTACVGSSDMCVVFNGTGGGTGSVAMPTSLAVIDTSTTEVSLTWSPPTNWTPQTNTITGYNVYRDNNPVPIATTQPFTTNFLDGSKGDLNPGSNHTYTVAAVTSTGTSAQTAGVSGTLGAASSAISLNSCPISSTPGTITDKSGNVYENGGNFVLTGNVTFSSGNCFDVLSRNSQGGDNPISNFNLDCQGNAIIDTGTTHPNMVYLANAQHSMVVNCKFENQIQPNDSNGISLDNGSGNDINSYDTVEGNTFGDSNSLNGVSHGVNSDVDLVTRNTAYSVIDNNTLFAGSISDGSIMSSNTTINGNTVTTCGTNPSNPNFDSPDCADSIVVGGTNNIVGYNNTNGYGQKFYTDYGPQGGASIGTDDGIDLYGAPTTSGDMIVYNNIQNNYDCGLELEAEVDNSYIGYNTMTRTGGCGAIGGGIGITMTNDTFDHNTAVDSSDIFYFIQADATPGTYYFQGNKFLSNVFQPGQDYRARGDLFAPGEGAGYVSGYNLIATNNTFSNNTFQPPADGENPIFNPASLAVDGGGNKWCPNSAIPGTLISYPQLTDDPECSNPNATGW